MCYVRKSVCGSEGGEMLREMLAIYIWNPDGAGYAVQYGVHPSTTSSTPE